MNSWILLSLFVPPRSKLVERYFILLGEALMIKLYGGTLSRAVIVKWYLEELGVPYEFVLVDLKQGDNLQPAYLAINPFGKVPAIDDDGFVLFESGAILTYLASKYDKAVDTAEKVTIANQWVFFAFTTLGDGLFAPHLKEKETPYLLGILNKMFAQHPYILGANFSVGDVAVASVLNYAGMFLPDLDMSPYPQVVSYLQRLRERPAYKVSMNL
jgi:glutathione S-transferase